MSAVETLTQRSAVFLVIFASTERVSGESPTRNASNASLGYAIFAPNRSSGDLVQRPFLLEMRLRHLLAGTRLHQLARVYREMFHRAHDRTRPVVPLERVSIHCAERTHRFENHTGKGN